jgi:phosphoacetylglucosamine mutase
VKHLHHAAQQFDVGIYFEANGHGTVLFKPQVTDSLRSVTRNAQSTRSNKDAAERLLLLIDLINQTVGDAISDLLVVECILAARDWDIASWNSQYTDLPNRQLKIAVKDRAVIQTTDAERRVTEPAELQTAVDQLVAKYTRGRSFVRPSGTEDVVRVYAEADTQENADLLAYEVSLAVYNLAGGVGPIPSPP